MPRFVVTCPFGLRNILKNEVESMGIKVKEVEDHAVIFESNWRSCYRVNLRSRFASRVLMSILDFNAYNEDEIYSSVKKHDFTKYIDQNQTIAVHTNIRMSNTFRDQRFISMKVKDAIVDQFYEKFGSRPSVDRESADLNVYVRLDKNEFQIAIDTSGEALFQRGYKDKLGLAGLKENLAAALVKLSGYEFSNNLYDPFCGAGTILIEAAMMAKNIYPGLNRDFSFQSWKAYQNEVFQEEYNLAESEKKETDLRFFGSDINGLMIQSAKQHAKQAGVEDIIDFSIQSVEDFMVDGKATIISNPPYAERMGTKEEIIELYQVMGKVFFQLKGWRVCLLSGDAEMTSHLRLKADQKIPLKNGDIDCRFLRYFIH